MILCKHNVTFYAPLKPFMKNMGKIEIRSRVSIIYSIRGAIRTILVIRVGILQGVKMKWVVLCMLIHACGFSYIQASNPNNFAEEESGSSSDEFSDTIFRVTPPDTPKGIIHLPAAKRGTLSDGLGNTAPARKYSQNPVTPNVPEDTAAHKRVESRDSGNLSPSPRGDSSDEQRLSIMPSSQGALQSERGSEKTELLFSADGGTDAQKELVWQARERAFKDKEIELKNRELELHKSKETALIAFVKQIGKEQPKKLAEVLGQHVKPEQLCVMLPIMMEIATTETRPPDTKKVPRILTPAEIANIVGLYYNSGVAVSVNYFNTLKKENNQNLDGDDGNITFVNPRDVVRYVKNPSELKKGTPFFDVPAPQQKTDKKWWCC